MKKWISKWMSGKGFLVRLAGRLAVLSDWTEVARSPWLGHSGWAGLGWVPIQGSRFPEPPIFIILDIFLFLILKN